MKKPNPNWKQRQPDRLEAALRYWQQWSPASSEARYAWAQLMWVYQTEQVSVPPLFLALSHFRRRRFSENCPSLLQNICGNHFHRLRRFPRIYRLCNRGDEKTRLLTDTSCI